MNLQINKNLLKYARLDGVLAKVAYKIQKRREMCKKPDFSKKNLEKVDINEYNNN